ncbi:FAS1-like dehydratase domain-containing protein [Alteripontixanthobacter maritimus]|nr:MaoC family dehydratase N-terminal domain-containing protein [Alteripontixanthobacter maritimus]
MTETEFSHYVGREQYQHDRVGAALVRRFAAALDVPLADNSVPDGLHWCLCTPETPTEELGPDGHPKVGGFLPDMGLPRRMWAASEVEFFAPLTLDAKVTRASRILSVERKDGRSGPLGFVKVAHETRCGDVLAVRETQTLVYREAQAARVELPPIVNLLPEQLRDWQWHRELTPEPVLLQRFSALTFNSHRIHYDLPYAREVEGYPGLVVHGPLMATLLLDLARRELGGDRLASFAFRAMSPAFAGQPLHLVGRSAGEEVILQALGGDGRMVVDASAKLREG